MKQNNFYEVDGCTDFIPVTINETYADSDMQGYRLVVKEVYSFPKVDETQKPVVPKFVADWVDDSREYSLDFEWAWDAGFAKEVEEE